MYRQLARWFQESAQSSSQTASQDAALRVFDLHPLQLSRFLEEAWFMRTDEAGRPSQAVPQDLLLPPGLGSGLGDMLKSTTDIYPVHGTPSGRRAVWNHLIYAYMIENTRIVEIMRRVVKEYLHGEALEVPSAATHRWLRSTEDLFCRDAASAGIHALTSWVRPDIGGSRRNAYFRFFGMDLNHGTADNNPYPYEKPAAANRDFVKTLEEFLRETWKGIENSVNTSGVNVTDDAGIANFAQQLYDMMRVRRRNGNLSREEYVHVTTMSWFHLTVEFDSPVVRDLKSEATSPEERLRKVGERVGLPAHAKSESYFILAEALSRLLISTEMGLFNDAGNVRALYAPPTPGTPNPLRDDVMAIITHWSAATGRDLKAGKVTTSPRAPVSTNGHRPAATIPAPVR